jgi:predicted transcriptional regulator
MTIELRPEHQHVIDLAIQSGAPRDPEEMLVEQREAVAAKIATGFAQAERGELIDGEEAIRMMRQRRAERLKTQR